MKVKTDYSKCPYITVGKLYKIELDSDGGHTIFDDVGDRVWIIIGDKGCPHLKNNRWQIIDEKPFDITQHEFSDERLSFSGDTLDADVGCCAYYDDSIAEVINYDFNKTDAIAIAKHFKLTAEDLK